MASAFLTAWQRPFWRGYLSPLCDFFPKHIILQHLRADKDLLSIEPEPPTWYDLRAGRNRLHQKCLHEGHLHRHPNTALCLCSHRGMLSCSKRGFLIWNALEVPYFFGSMDIRLWKSPFYCNRCPQGSRMDVLCTCCIHCRSSSKCRCGCGKEEPPESSSSLQCAAVHWKTACRRCFCCIKIPGCRKSIFTLKFFPLGGVDWRWNEKAEVQEVINLISHHLCKTQRSDVWEWTSAGFVWQKLETCDAQGCPQLPLVPDQAGCQGCSAPGVPALQPGVSLLNLLIPDRKKN